MPAMQSRRLGDSGLRVSAVSLGSWLTFGESVDATATAELVRHAYELGIRLFDTADVYGGGAAEEVLGTALAPLPRRQLVIATKCFFPCSDGANDRGLSRKHLVESVETSLRRLRTEYLDLHQCHRYDPHVPLEETVRTYGDLIRQGKMLYWGVSMWNAEQIADAVRMAEALGVPRPVSNQPSYSIAVRDIETEVMPRCRALGLGQIVFSPLGQGALTGKYSGGQRPSGSRADDERLSRWMGRYLDSANLARIDRLQPIAEGLGVSMAQLALAWCLHRPEVASVIVGVTRTSQLDENVRAAELALPDEVVAEIDALFPPGTSLPMPAQGPR